MVGIPRDKDMRIRLTLKRTRIDLRQRLQSLQQTPIGFSSCCGQNVVEHFRMPSTVRMLIPDGNTFRVKRNLVHHGARIQQQLLRENVLGFVSDHLILQGPHRSASSKDTHVHAQSMQRLSQLKTNYSGAHNRNTLRQCPPFENIIVDHESQTQVFPFFGIRRGRTGRHNNGFGSDSYTRNVQRVRIHQRCPSHDFVGFGNGIHALQYKANESIALPANPVHHLMPVDAVHTCVNTEGFRMRHAVRRVGGRNQ